MSTSKEFHDYLLEQMSGLEGVTSRAMMGEYVLYYRGRIFGGIYDDRLLVKPVKSAIALLADAVPEPPYKGAKDMLPVENPENRELLVQLVETMYDELPEPKPKKRKI